MVQNKIEIKRALISVYDKSRLEEMLKILAPDVRNIELISSGGTAKEIARLGYKVIDVGTYTGYPESPDGLVKTLHPKIHAGLLLDPEHIDAKTGQKEHERYIRENNIPLIDLFVGNLYPFQETVVKNPGNYEKIRENEDIGGPAMIRAAAKNFKRVAVLVNWSDLEHIKELESSEQVPPIGTDMRARVMLMQHAFSHTRDYEGAIDDFWSHQDPYKVAEYFLKEEK